ncbi:MAG TPA: efflux RND transporter periplasmic adaptor subunit, partial [Chthoniobacterales bacterium]|nr:efflux RND transporter periplasmic adaptor subunit [Chthoniobacterales bacterium]
MKAQLSTQKIATLIALLALLLSGASCSKSSGSKKPDNVDYYTCTMHPSVKSQDPNGKCPICSMDLVPVMKKGGTGASASSPKPEGMKDMPGMQGMPGMKGGAETKAPQTSEFIVPVERQQQIGVRWAKAERKPLRHTIRSVGMVVPDKSRNWQFVSRVDGYVQKLNVTSPGEIVEKDAPLLAIYSPDLLTSEREFVELLRMRDEAKTKDAR